MAKKEKMNLEDYCLSDTIINIIEGVSTGSCYKDAYSPVLLNCAVEKGYVEYNIESKNELLRLTKKGKSLYRKLQHCVLEDIKRNSK